MTNKIIKRMTSMLLVMAMIIALLPVFATTSFAATGYDRGYKGGMAGDGYIRAYGIDVSEHQGIGFNFQNIKNNGYSFVILRCGFVSRKDYRFEEYYKAAKAAGLNVGVYFYSYATNASEAAYEADRCLSYISGKTFEYPVYFDFEDASARSYNGNTAYSICRAFLDKIAAAGYLTGLYGYAGWMDPNYGAWVPTASICGGKYECWMANYYNGSPTNAKSANYPKTYGMYQYTSTNYVGGVGPLDTNVCYKDYPTIVKTYGFNGYSATGGYASIPDGTYTISTAKDSNYQIDIDGQSTENAAQAKLWTTNNCNSQKFVFQKDGTDTYTIRNVNSNRYLEIRNGGSNGEYKVTQCHYTGANCQRWYLIKNNDGSYCLKNKGTGKYLDLSNGKIANGTDIQTWNANGTDAQKWSLKPTDTLIDGVYTVRCAADNSYGWDISGNSKDDGANLQAWNSQHKFVITHATSGYYTIRVLNSGKYLDVYCSNTANGTNITQYKNTDTDNQKWLVIPNTDGTYSFVSKCNGKYIDLNNGSTANGTNLQCWSGNGTSSQKWNMVRQGVVGNDTYFIGNAADKNYRLEISARSTDNGANLILYSAHGATSQQFKFEKQSDGFYTITNVNSGKQIDVAGGGKTAGTNIQQWGDNGANQKWSVIPNTDGSYSFASATNNLYLDLSGNTLKNDQNIHCWTPNGGGAQKWSLTLASHTHSYSTKVVAPTKTAQGYTLHTCACGQSYKDNFVDPDTAGPTITDVQITEVTSGGYRVTCKVSDSSGVKEVKFPTWTDANGQDEIIWYVGSLSNGVATYYVPVDDHHTEFGKYITHIYAYDTLGNYTCVATSANVPARDATTTMSGTLYTGVYSIGNAQNKNFVLDVSGQSMDNGANIHMWQAHGGESQMWVITNLNNGYYTIRNLKTGKYLDAIGSGTTKGTNVDQWAGGTYDNQMWSVTVNSNGTYTFVNKCNGLALDMSDGGWPKNGTNVQMWTKNTTNAQQWYLTPQKVVANGTYKLGNIANSNMQIEVSNSSTANGGNVQIWTSHSGNCQKWKITAGGDGLYTITNVNSGKVMDVSAWGTENGTNIHQWDSSSGKNQKWLVIRNTDGSYTFISACNGLALDMSGGGTPKNGQNIQCWKFNNSSAQKWILK